MNVDLYQACIFCSRPRDAYSDPSLYSSLGRRSQESSTSFSVAHRSKASAGFGNPAGKVDISSARHTSEGVSPKSGSPINSRPDVTHEETSTSLSEISKYAHRRAERELPIEEPVDETQNHRKSEKSAITGDEISIPEDTYEQWIAADILRDDYGDTRLSDDVEQEYVDGPPSDPESDFDSFLRSLTEPRTDDHSSDDSDRSERTKTKPNRGPLLPPVIYMLLLRVCGLVTRLFEPNPLPGRTRIRWRCVSCSRYVLLMQKFFLHMTVTMRLLWLLIF